MKDAILKDLGLSEKDFLRDLIMSENVLILLCCLSHFGSIFATTFGHKGR